MFSLLFTFCLHFYLINIHVFDYPDSRLSGLFAEVPKSPDNRGSTVFFNCFRFVSKLDAPASCFIERQGIKFNPLSPSIKLQILLLCFHTFLTEVVGRSC